jgi:uroporphyrinogen decarboxylase
MKPRIRVETALRHEQPDRCPFQVSFTPEFARRLRRELGMERNAGHNPHGGGNLYDLEIALGQDMLLTSVGWANCYYQQDEPYTDEWGIPWKLVDYETPYGKGRYTEIAGHPLADDSAIDSYVPPDPNRPELYAEAERVIREYKTDYWIVGVTVTTIFECAWALRGLSRLMKDFVGAPARAEALLDIPYQYHLTAARRLVELGVDMLWLGDDIGAQTGMMISPAHWRRFLKPRMATFISTLKAINPELKVAYHSDGDVYPIIPELIEIGLDVLNPVQPACMDPARLKREFGERLCFWGTIDEQHTLPFGSAADVRNEVLARINTVGEGGGLILSPTHHVQLDTPMENFRAMVDAVRAAPGEK